jgi:hypothetical protein
MSSHSERMYNSTQKMIIAANFKLQNPIGIEEVRKTITEVKHKNEEQDISVIFLMNQKQELKGQKEEKLKGGKL